MKSDAPGNVIVPLVTPRHSKDFFPLLDHILDGGIQDLVFFGTTGEGDKIDLKTKKKLLKQVVPYVQERARLYIGLLESSLDNTVSLLRLCDELGFTAALVPESIYASKPTALATILSATSMNLLLYNRPGLWLDNINQIIPSSCETRILGIKDSSGDIDLVKTILEARPSSSFKVYYGREYQLQEALSLDVDGIFPATGNIEPGLLLKLWKERDETSFSLLNRLKKEISRADPHSYVNGLKTVLVERGILSE